MCLDGVLAGAVKGLDSQILLDPLEEELHMPAALVDLWDGQSGQREVVGEEDEILLRVGVHITDASKCVGIIPRRIMALEPYGLIGAKARGFVDRSMFQPDKTHVGFGSGDEEGCALDKDMETGEIDVTTVHGVEGSRLQNQLVQGVDIVDFPVGNMDEAGDISPQIDERVELDGRLVFAKLRPGEQRQTQIDGGRIEGVCRLFQGHAEIVACIERSRAPDKDLSEVGIDLPGASFVGVREGVARDASAPEPRVIESRLKRAQTNFDVAEAFAIGQLSKGQTKELIEAEEGLHLVIAAIAANALSKFVQGKEIHNLGKEGPSAVHRPIPPMGNGLMLTWT